MHEATEMVQSYELGRCSLVEVGKLVNQDMGKLDNVLEDRMEYQPSLSFSALSCLGPSGHYSEVQISNLRLSGLLRHVSGRQTCNAEECSTETLPFSRYNPPQVVSIYSIMRHQFGP